MRLPPKPRLHRSFQIIPVPGSDELQLQSEVRSLRLKPQDGSNLLTRLVARLDGTRTIDELVRELGPDVVESLQDLAGAHLLEDAETELDEPQLALFSQFSDRPAELQARLAAARVGVTGTQSLVAMMLESLSGTGIVPRAVAEGELDLLIVALDRYDPVLLEEMNQQCLEAKRMWLPACLQGWELSLGPTVIPHQTACYRCFDLRMKANLEHYAPYMLYEQQLRAGHTPPAVGTLRPFQRLLAELAAVEAVKLLTRFSPPTTVGRLYTLDLLTLEARHHDVLKLPRCPACGEPARSAPMMRPWSE